MTIGVLDKNSAPQTIQTLDDLTKGAGASDAATLRVNIATDSAVIGGLTETAPATDTASSGLNGRLQRIAQRLTSLIALVPAALGANGGFKIEGVASGTVVPISDGSGSLTVDAPVGTPAFVRLSDGSAAITTLAVSLASVPSHAVTNAGTFAVQAAVTAASGSIASGAVASGAVASGAFASGSVASGAIVDGAMVTMGAKTDAKSTATDTTSVSVVSVLKQISASIQAAAASLAGSLAITGQGYQAQVTLTRTADTNAYTANDILGAATGSTAALTFTSMGPSGGSIMITSATLEIDASAIISGETSYNLYLYNVTPPSALGDNAAFDIPSGDRASFLAKISFGAPIDEGSTLIIQTDAINKQVKLAGTSLFGYLVTVGAYTPTSARVHVLTLNTVAL